MIPLPDDLVAHQLRSPFLPDPPTTASSLASRTGLFGPAVASRRTATAPAAGTAQHKGADNRRRHVFDEVRFFARAGDVSSTADDGEAVRAQGEQQQRERPTAPRSKQQRAAEESSSGWSGDEGQAPARVLDTSHFFSAPRPERAASPGHPSQAGQEGEEDGSVDDDDDDMHSAYSLEQRRQQQQRRGKPMRAPDRGAATSDEPHASSQPAALPSQSHQERHHDLAAAPRARTHPHPRTRPPKLPEQLPLRQGDYFGTLAHSNEGPNAWRSAGATAPKPGHPRHQHRRKEDLAKSHAVSAGVAPASTTAAASAAVPAPPTSPVRTHRDDAEVSRSSPLSRVRTLRELEALLIGGGESNSDAAQGHGREGTGLHDEEEEEGMQEDMPDDMEEMGGGATAMRFAPQARAPSTRAASPAGRTPEASISSGRGAQTRTPLLRGAAGDLRLGGEGDPDPDLLGVFARPYWL